MTGIFFTRGEMMKIKYYQIFFLLIFANIGIYAEDDPALIGTWGNSFYGAIHYEAIYKFYKNGEGEMIVKNYPTLNMIMKNSNIITLKEKITFTYKIEGSKILLIRHNLLLKSGLYSYEINPKNRLKIYMDNEILELKKGYILNLSGKIFTIICILLLVGSILISIIREQKDKR